MLSYNRLDLAISGESFGRFLEIRFPLPFTLGGLVGVSWPLALELTGTSSNLSRFDGCLAAAEWLALMRATSFSKASDTWAVGGALRSPLFDEHSPKIVGIRGTGSREERARPVQTIVDECFLKNWFSKTSRWRRVRVSIAMLWRGVDGCGVKRRMMQLVNCSRFYTSWGRRGLRSCHNDWSLATSNRKKPPQLTRFRVSPDLGTYWILNIGYLSKYWILNIGYLSKYWILNIGYIYRNIEYWIYIKILNIECISKYWILDLLFNCSGTIQEMLRHD